MIKRIRRFEGRLADALLMSDCTGPTIDAIKSIKVFECGFKEEGISMAEQIVACNPMNADYSMNLISFYCETDNKDKAVKECIRFFNNARINNEYIDYMYKLDVIPRSFKDYSG